MFVASRSILCCTRTRTSGTSGTQYNNVRRPYGFTSKRESDARVCRPVSPVVPSHSESTECIPYFVFYLCKRSASVCVCDWHLIGAITVRCVCALCVRACACENKYIPHAFGAHWMRIFLIFRGALMLQFMRGACVIFNCKCYVCIQTRTCIAGSTVNRITGETAYNRYISVAMLE